MTCTTLSTTGTLLRGILSTALISVSLPEEMPIS